MGKKRNQPVNPGTASGVLLGIMLLPTIAGACTTGVGASSEKSAFAPPAASVLSDSTSRTIRSRRTEDAVENVEYPSRSSLLAVSKYLQCLSNRQTPSASITASWNRFHNWCDRQIRNYAGRYYRTSSDIDDCAQETWVDLTRRLKDFDLDASRGKFTSWLYTLVRNNAVDLSRAMRRQRASSLNDATAGADPSCPEPNPMETLSRKLDAQRVREAVEQLKDRVSAESYEIARLRWIDQRPLEDVKAKLRMTANQIWAREHRLRQKLRGMLEPIVID
jgi:RNA polymerase sigma factor (sigma-70 family)